MLHFQINPFHFILRKILLGDLQVRLGRLKKHEAQRDKVTCLKPNLNSIKEITFVPWVVEHCYMIETQKSESTFKGTQVWFRVLILATLLGSSISSFKSHDCSPWFRLWLGHLLVLISLLVTLGKSNNISYLTSFYFLMKRMNDINSFNFKCMLWELSRQYTGSA